MRVDANSPLRPAIGLRGDKAASIGGGGFAEQLGSEPTAAAAKPAPACAVGGLFALQEVEDATAERRKAVARGGRILDRLRELQHGLLSGTLDRSALADLAAQAKAARSETADPGLEQLLDEIELRAAVELAKLSDAL